MVENSNLLLFQVNRALIKEVEHDVRHEELIIDLSNKKYLLQIIVSKRANIFRIKLIT